MEFCPSIPPPTLPHRRRPAVLLTVIALGLYAVLLAWFMDPYAAGSDTSGYLNHAKLLGSGHLHVALRTIPGLPPARLPYDSYTPLGLKPAPNGDGLVPTYPSGLPLLILAAAQVVGWGWASSLVIGAHAFLGVLLTYALGRTLGLPSPWAILGAAVIAVSPLYLLYSVQVMSDVPSMAWTVAAVLAAWHGGTQKFRNGLWWALGSGAALSLAVLIRPNNILALIPIGIAAGRLWRRWVMLVLGSLPGAIFFGVHSQLAYGSVLATGYGYTLYLFSTALVPRTFVHYALWLPLLFTPLVLLSLGLPWLKGPPRAVAVLGGWILPYLVFYAFYRSTHETWWYLRYLLPAAPALVVGGLLVARQWRPFPCGKTALAVAIALILANGVWWEQYFGVLNTAEHDRTYPLTMAWLGSHLPAGAVVASWQASGAVFYYTPFAILRWDMFDARAFVRIAAAARDAHRPIYAVLFPYERDPALDQRMPGRWTSVARIRDMTVWRWDGGRRPRSMKPNGIRLAGFATVAWFLGMVLRFWHPVFGFTGLLQLGASPDNAKIAAFRDLPVYVYPYRGSYDGVAYAQIAYHPLLNAPETRTTIDRFAYRARRIVPSALAWLLAGGNPRWIVQVYPLINAAAWLILAGVLWRLLAVDDLRAWVAWAGVLFSAGALASVRLALTDLTALAAIAGAMLALERGRKGWATAWLAIAGLSRETSLLALPALWGRGQVEFSAVAQRDSTKLDLTPSLRRTLLAIAPLALWMAYIRWETGPGNQGWDNFARPFSGFVAKWQTVLADMASATPRLLAWTTLLATAGLTVQAAWFAAIARRRTLLDPWWRIGVAYAALMLVLGPAVWDGYPGAAARVVLPMTLAFNVLACRRRAALILLLAGNLTVPAGLLAMKNHPPRSQDIAAAHSDGLAYLARVDDGWYKVERTNWHARTWSSGAGALEIETWPHATRDLRLTFSIRSLVPRAVAIRQGPALLWRGTVGSSYEQVTIPFAATGGRAVLEFSTDSPAVVGGFDGDQRLLAFALRDPRIVVSKP